MEKTDKLTAKIWEVKHGWAYAVFTGDGSEEGSLKSAAGAFVDFEAAFKEAKKGLKRTIEMRDCDHEIVDSFCTKCRLWDYDGQYGV